MKHIQTLNGATLKQSAAHGGCGECQTSCQSEVREQIKNSLRRGRCAAPASFTMRKGELQL